MATKSIPRLSPYDWRRFEKFLQRDEATGCLLWTGNRHRLGYGLFKKNGTVYLAHRIAFVGGGGVLTAERPFVLHDCPCGDEPACCCFVHLWAGTQADNVRDMFKKGRWRRSKRGLPRGVTIQVSGRYAAQASVGGKTLCFGTYDTMEEAGQRAALARLDHGIP